MNCPVCREPMIVLECESVEVDYCTTCEGIWLDAGELELLFGDVATCRTFMRGGPPSGNLREKPRRCPVCRKNMTKTDTVGEHPVTYDSCSRGDGLWFDKGELAIVLEHGAPDSEGDRVTRFLREVFSHPHG